MTQDKDREIAYRLTLAPELVVRLYETLRSVREEAVRDSKQQIDRLEKEKRELIEALRQAQLGLSQAAMERQAPCFVWPLQEVEKVLAKHKQSETKGDERESA